MVVARPLPDIMPFKPWEFRLELDPPITVHLSELLKSRNPHALDGPILKLISELTGPAGRQLMVDVTIQPAEDNPEFSLRRFVLDRDEDVSGVTGTGIVADGVQFPDGRIAFRWRGKKASTVSYDSIDDIIDTHGHGGKTHVVWLDA